MSGFEWVELGNGRSVYRAVPPETRVKRSDLPCPMLALDTMEPVQSMVDGSWHTSKSSLRATYKPSGNKEGKEYVEVGNDPARLRPRPKHKPDRKAIRESIVNATARFDRGERVKRQ